MSTRSTDYREAVEHLPEGSMLFVQDVSWEDYEQLLDDLVDRPGVRVTYDEGKLGIMSPLSGHEKCKRFIERMIDAVGEELDVNMEPLGSTTWKRERYKKGTEPDTCYYIANAERIIGKRNIDLDVDPPPDLVVEIDATNELRGAAYAEIPSSRSFPILTANALANFIEQRQNSWPESRLDRLPRMD